MQNVTEILRCSAERFGEKAVQRFFNGTDWVDRSYRQLWEDIQATCRGLVALGVRPGDRVAIMATTRPDWVLADYAILCADGVTVPIYPSSTPDQVRHICEDAEVRWAIVENSIMAAKLPDFSHCIMMTGDDDVGCRSLANLKIPGEPIAPARGLQDLATLVYTSGTTGLPKGVMLTHGNLLANVESILKVAATWPSMRMTPDDVALSFLPLSHILERTGHNVLLHEGVTIAYARSTDQLAQDLLAVRPTLMIAVPRVFEKIHGRIITQVGQYSWPKRWVFEASVRAGKKYYHQILSHPPAPIRRPWTSKWYDRLVLQKIRAAIGGRLRYVIAGGASLSKEIGLFFFAMGIPVLEGYGLTETAPVLTLNVPEWPRYGSVGVALPGVDLAIAEDGEILARGPNVSPGYWHLEAETAAAFVDGWFHTGDVGELTDGYLRVTGRKKQIIVLSTGKNVSPQTVEQKLMLSPLVEQAVVVGNGRKFVSALLYLDPDGVHDWAQSRRKAITAIPALLSDPDLLPYVMEEVRRVTAELALFEQPKRVAFLPEPLSEERGELTPSLKVKRAVVEARYHALIDTLYSEADANWARAANQSAMQVSRALLAIAVGVGLALVIRWMER
ncbi:MAG: long-chain fatty acid--CoA ligase [Sulfobacillus acidophilus]|uniref:Long-chain fatty acid--CoA ligase n=1 Tax=Sulfobacillus acidophilus TaxID=53633 RepID=A0A2T2WJ07_9FIRM|nr:MAG: long-chain fatty acid--CoA ligase [Sulfobacillus acidophilus]